MQRIEWGGFSKARRDVWAQAAIYNVRLHGFIHGARARVRDPHIDFTVHVRLRESARRRLYRWSSCSCSCGI